MKIRCLLFGHTSAGLFDKEDFMLMDTHEKFTIGRCRYCGKLEIWQGFDMNKKPLIVSLKEFKEGE